MPDSPALVFTCFDLLFQPVISKFQWLAPDRFFARVRALGPAICRVTNSLSISVVNLRAHCTTFGGRVEKERTMSDEPVMLALGEDYPELRQSVRRICEKYPGAYWRKLEDEQAYPSQFIAELTEGGFLASLIPEEYGGSGLPLRAAAVILEEINASGCTASQGH